MVELTWLAENRPPLTGPLHRPKLGLRSKSDAKRLESTNGRALAGLDEELSGFQAWAIGHPFMNGLNHLGHWTLVRLAVAPESTQF
jgi:hypothetical protein